MFKKITALTIVGVACITNGVFAYTTTDVQNANYLATRDIIRDSSSNPDNYFLEHYISRAEIMGMLITITGVTRNTSCRGDFADINMNAPNSEWVCRTIETAADRGYINAMSGVEKSMRFVRPYDNITRSEALGILMKAFPNNGIYTGFAYYWTDNFPIEGQTTGYSEYYNFGAEWQARAFYAYIRKILVDDTQLSNNPRVNEPAQLKEVFGFAKNIMEKR